MGGCGGQRGGGKGGSGASKKQEVGKGGTAGKYEGGNSKGNAKGLNVTHKENGQMAKAVTMLGEKLDKSMKIQTTIAQALAGSLAKQRS